MMKYFFDLIICLQFIIIQILFSYSFLSYLNPSFLSIKKIFFKFSLTKIRQQQQLQFKHQKQQTFLLLED